MSGSSPSTDSVGNPEALTDPVIEIRDVVKRFVSGARTITALDHLSAAIQAGYITGLVGPDS